MQLLLPYFQKGYIYLIENIQNHKKYIGKTGYRNIEEYIEKHFENAISKRDLKKYKNGKYLYNAIRKYGRQNFKIIILGEIFGNTLEELNDNLNEAEIACIYHFRTFGSDGEHEDNIYGYNRTKGGDGLIGMNKGKTYEEIYGKERAKEIMDNKKITLHLPNDYRDRKSNIKFFGEEIANEISKKLIIQRNKPSHINKKHTIETKNKIREKRLGKPSPQKGKTYEEIYGKERAEELKSKNTYIRENRKGKTYKEEYGEEKAQEIKKKLSISVSNAKIKNIDLKELIDLFFDKKNLFELSKYFNVSKSTIKRRLIFLGINSRVLIRGSRSKNYLNFIEENKNNKETFYKRIKEKTLYEFFRTISK